MILFLVGLPARPKSPLDPKKDGESLSYSMLPLSDGPEGSHSRPQVISVEYLSSIKMFNILLICVLKMSHLLNNNRTINFQGNQKPESARCDTLVVCVPVFKLQPLTKWSWYLSHCRVCLDFKWALWVLCLVQWHCGV